MLLLSPTVFLSLKFAHLGTCIAPSEDLYYTIRGPASEHSKTCIGTSEDLHQNIQTCITPSAPTAIRTFIRPFKPAAFYRNLSGHFWVQCFFKMIFLNKKLIWVFPHVMLEGNWNLFKIFHWRLSSIRGSLSLKVLDMDKNTVIGLKCTWKKTQLSHSTPPHDTHQPTGPISPLKPDDPS